MVKVIVLHSYGYLMVKIFGKLSQIFLWFPGEKRVCMLPRSRCILFISCWLIHCYDKKLFDPSHFGQSQNFTSLLLFEWKSLTNFHTYLCVIQIKNKLVWNQGVIFFCLFYLYSIITKINYIQTFKNMIEVNISHYGCLIVKSLTNFHKYFCDFKISMRWNGIKMIFYSVYYSILWHIRGSIGMYHCEI